MKKIIFILFFILISTSQVNAESNFETDYTLIDCVNWDNVTWVPFDSTMPYATLKSWIENTITYINNNINKIWNEETASWKTLTIKVQCSFNDILNQSINLNFNWVAYNNELIIEWIDDNSFIVSNTYFYWWWGNVVIKNANFINAYNWEYYFNWINWLQILDSYFKINKWENFWKRLTYKYYNSYKSWFNNKFIIENSIIDVEIWTNYNFWIPTFLKNNKINFNNIDWTWTYSINFYIQPYYHANTYIVPCFYFNNSSLVSNEIDLWWNNFTISDFSHLNFINNKFINFNNFSMWDSTNLFINNLIENNNSIDISNHKFLYNNIFEWWFTDTYDIMNFRKNFTLSNIWNGWLWWVFKKNSSINIFNLNFNSADLYKEITGKILPKWLGDIYVIFNY